MGGDTEAAGDVLTGAVIAGTLESTAATPATKEPDGTQHAHCLNCGARLTGAFCAACGQSAHLHRSLLSLGHDILHGVFHFEGKIWRTLPELMFFPGRLTRRYLDGERAKFVSPMALFLFTVFLMFAVFAFTGITSVDSSLSPAQISPAWQAGNQAAIDETNANIDALREQLQDPTLTAERRSELEAQIEQEESARAVMEALAAGDWKRLAEIDEQQSKKTAKIQIESGDDVWPKPGSRLANAIEQVQNNPELLLYKIKTSAYKYSWALVPLSVPFLWLLFFWRRDIHLYDHAIFTTYSISFMMMFMMLVALAASLGVPSAIWGTALAVIPPLHIYKQLRGAYRLSRAGALVRLFFLLIAIAVILSLFTALLVVAGVLV